MFKRTVSFWCQLLSGKPTAANDQSTTTQEDERRAWDRYPVNFTTRLQPVKDGDQKPVSVRIRNISLGGVLLHASRSFAEGELVSIELPGATDQERSNVLACVVHVSPLSRGSWAVGCTFSRELSADDLHGFGVKRLRHAASDQRTWMRFSCDVTATCQAVASPTSSALLARVLNVSASGVGLQVKQEVANGTLLSVELQAAHGDFKRTMLACVVHVTEQADGVWALGCNFIRSLSEADLKALV